MLWLPYYCKYMLSLELEQTDKCDMTYRFKRIEVDCYSDAECFIPSRLSQKREVCRGAPNYE
jgi:hypothetical protein